MFSPYNLSMERLNRWVVDERQLHPKIGLDGRPGGWRFIAPSKLYSLQ
jgi:hypothetical protein